MNYSAQSQLELVIIKISREAKNSKEIVLVGLGPFREHLQITVCWSGALHLQQRWWAGRDTGQGSGGSRQWSCSGEWENRSEAPQRAPKFRWDREDKKDENFLLSVLFNALQMDKILRKQKIPDYATCLELLATGYEKLVGAKNRVTQIWRRTRAHWRVSTCRNITCASQQIGGADGKKVWACYHMLTRLLHSSITLKITSFWEGLDHHLGRFMDLSNSLCLKLILCYYLPCFTRQIHSLSMIPATCRCWWHLRNQIGNASNGEASNVYF